MNPKPSSIDEYFTWFSPEIQERLFQIRETLRKVLPEAKEVISYHMPAFKTSEILVYYAAAKNHIGFYPTNSGVTEFKKELGSFQTSKGAIQFPYNKPLPLDLIGRIAEYRYFQVKERLATKGKKSA